MEYINQTQVNPAAGITFASGLRAILRQDPNIVMIGEIRDNETADIAVQAALTGHLVLSSIHTNDAPTAIPRLLDMGIPAFLAAAVLNVISAQRLVRRLHPDCMQSYTPDKAILEAIEKELLDLEGTEDKVKSKLPKVLYKAGGCLADGSTGYLGRLGIYEVLKVTEEIRKLISTPAFSLDAARQKARSLGMISMFEDGLRKAEKGVTSIEEVFRVIKD
jgi:type IV pilus assembly protein PilB